MFKRIIVLFLVLLLTACVKSKYAANTDEETNGVQIKENTTESGDPVEEVAKEEKKAHIKKGLWQE